MSTIPQTTQSSSSPTITPQIISISIGAIIPYYGNSNKVPDFRGYFLRGFDDGAGIDPSRANNTIQQDTVGPHNHPILLNGSVQNNWGLVRRSNVNENVTIQGVDTGDSGFEPDVRNPPYPPTIGNNGSTTETRPKNISVKYYILASTS